MSKQDEALAVLMHYHLQGVGSTFGLRVRERGDEYIAKRHADDHAVVPCPVCQAIAQISTKNGEEIEARKTVPMAMLREIANWEREDWTESLAIESIIARYGYEVTE